VYLDVCLCPENHIRDSYVDSMPGLITSNP
jgi:hypothetical protein